ncbi:hypothetical protein DCAR_0520362 [Daucus carota subsp. sativus]|uniref:Uncharacterized protein n=1 Tax=Daucus carota subsp. sativus TaxID=79200 RepID=A0AAF0X613_DAUCS|nr:PREDICTED: uncharacterized protein LOC108222390 [Daucus carota subsp. sativus]WOH00984.1 hypothetical protein DCAR_0520362 [Daucus carota subsp. sativus]
MKKISFLFSLMLLTTLLHEAQGLKSRKLLTETANSSSTSASKNHQEIEGNLNGMKVNGEMNTSATTKQIEGHGKQENFSVKSSPVQVEAAPKHYPDVLDIAGMDYSPARRKSPIHN